MRNPGDRERERRAKPQAGSGSQRRGGILLIAMVCIILLSLIFGAVVKIAQIERVQVRRGAARSQVRWLAESGASRGAAALANDPQYTGETWEVPASELGGDDSARVQISVEKSGDQTLLRVVATYPADDLAQPPPAGAAIPPDRMRYEQTWPVRRPEAPSQH